MRIAQVAPLAESVPPRLYGGTERVVSVLTEELVRRGHDVTLFASSDSSTRAKLVGCSEQGLRLDPELWDGVAWTTVELETVFGAEEDFDIIHNHVDYFAFPFARRSRTPVLTTTHGRLDLKETQKVYRTYSEHPLISISKDQRKPLPEANWLGTVYNGIDFERLKLQPEPGTYLAFLGRICPEKRVDRAIEVSRALEMPLKIAAKVDPVDQEYFEHAVRPFLKSPLIEYVGEVNEDEKSDFLGNAIAYLFPIDWPEPFGLTMIESMACGTPVIALAAGSVPEVVQAGVTGVICKSMRDFFDCVKDVPKIDRSTCREVAQLRFSGKAMADGYEAAYQALLQRKVEEVSLKGVRFSEVFP